MQKNVIFDMYKNFVPAMFFEENFFVGEAGIQQFSLW